MPQFTYLTILLACVLGTLPLEFALQARVYRRWVRTAAAVLPVAAVFVLWDYLAVRAGWWWFDPDRVTGIYLGVLPLEELLFFLVIPICAVLTLEAVRHLRPGWATTRRRPGDRS